MDPQLELSMERANREMRQVKIGWPISRGISVVSTRQGRANNSEETAIARGDSVSVGYRCLVVKERRVQLYN